MRKTTTKQFAIVTERLGTIEMKEHTHNRKTEHSILRYGGGYNKNLLSSKKVKQKFNYSIINHFSTPSLHKQFWLIIEKKNYLGEDGNGVCIDIEKTWKFTRENHAPLIE